MVLGKNHLTQHCFKVLRSMPSLGIGRHLRSSCSALENRGMDTCKRATLVTWIQVEGWRRDGWNSCCRNGFRRLKITHGQAMSVQHPKRTWTMDIMLLLIYSSPNRKTVNLAGHNLSPSHTLAWTGAWERLQPFQVSFLRLSKAWNRQRLGFDHLQGLSEHYVFVIFNLKLSFLLSSLRIYRESWQSRRTRATPSSLSSIAIRRLWLNTAPIVCLSSTIGHSMAISY
ncbi:hypothetical protein BKA70DRAFT_838377 [Coprinopsis sp. MPI-PUGE-AT-0042]|nr:hypothetical protein BKA70DRAFT_838377 [Coprinopsis sp. MPI-PUGE-AT-0042]